VIIKLKKGKDGPSTLACIRSDGSATWAKLHPFFPLHDLTHCSVESVLGFDEAFFGLVASGWDIDAFAQPGAGARLPDQAKWAENIVGIFDRERASGETWSADSFNQMLQASLVAQKVSGFRKLSDRDLSGVRHLRDALHRQWLQLPVGASLEVAFPARWSTE